MVDRSAPYNRDVLREVCAAGLPNWRAIADEYNRRTGEARRADSLRVRSARIGIRTTLGTKPPHPLAYDLAALQAVLSDPSLKSWQARAAAYNARTGEARGWESFRAYAHDKLPDLCRHRGQRPDKPMSDIDPADYLKLAWHMSRPWRARFPHLHDDLIGAAYLAIVEAAWRFKGGSKFSTYAAFWIKRYCRECVADDHAIRIPAASLNAASEGTDRRAAAERVMSVAFTSDPLVLDHIPDREHDDAA